MSFVAIYKRNGEIQSENCYDYDEAKKWIDVQSEEKSILPLSIVDLSTKEMVWYSEFIGIDTCIYHTHKFINNL